MTKYWTPWFAYGSAQSITTNQPYFEIELKYLSLDEEYNNQTG